MFNQPMDSMRLESIGWVIQPTSNRPKLGNFNQYKKDYGPFLIECRV